MKPSEHKNIQKKVLYIFESLDIRVWEIAKLKVNGTRNYSRKYSTRIQRTKIYFLYFFLLVFTQDESYFRREKEEREKRDIRAAKESLNFIVFYVYLVEITFMYIIIRVSFSSFPMKWQRTRKTSDNSFLE
jgi:hypothetical protein